MAVNQVYKLSSHLPNTLDLGPRGCVWVQFLSPHEYPLVGLTCSLEADEYKWSLQKTAADGSSCWELIPFLDLEVRLVLGDRSLRVPVPWLREKSLVHSQRLLDLEDFLAPDDNKFSLQLRLKCLGYDCGELDGLIGPKTQAAIRSFQKDRDLSIDGIAGEATLGFLKEVFGA